MPTVTKIFNYTGTTQVLTIPPGTDSMDVTLWGGAGGAGGGDRGGPGGVGAAGHYVTASGVAISDAQIGRIMKIAVGGGGGKGSAGGNATGGINGKSLTGYSGGDGGRSGPNGSSGAGGGGGGASLITIDGLEIAVAGGGGGGGGAGVSSNGSAGINTNSAVADSPTTLGGNGGNHSGDGGGGGAGGGGDIGGQGGNGASGDNGAAGGRSGSNLVPSGGTEDNGSGVSPGGSGDANYESGIAIGSNSAGGNGKVVVVFNIGVQARYKVSGTWKNIDSIKYKVAGQWKNITAGYHKVAGVWKALFNAGVNVTSTAAGFGDNTGNPGPGSAGSPGSGGGGGGGRVICTWLQNKGMFSVDDLMVDQEYSIKNISRTTKIGYWFWAVPLVQYMQESDRNKSWFGGLVIKTIRVLAQARANELAYKMGKRKQRDILGICTRLIGESFCWLVGVCVRPFVERNYADWLEIYDPEIR